MITPEHFMGTSGFVWWFGIVEDRLDPLQLGRCKVRIFGFHSENTADLPTDHLPWAYPIHPITSAAMSGVGTTPLGPLEGTQIFGFFRDGDKAQEPVMLGTAGGRYDGPPDINDGFSDPKGMWPNLDVDSHDVNRLARGVQEKTMSEFKIQHKNKIKTTNKVSTTGDRLEQQWIEKAEGSPLYPHNHVRESESGHLEEFDDTPGFERIHRSHRSGTFEEVHADGSRVQKIYGENFKVVVEDENVAIYGTANVTINGNSNILVHGDANMEVDGDKTEMVHGNVTRIVHGNLTERVAGTINTISDSSIVIKGADTNIHTDGLLQLRSGGNTNIDASGDIDAQAALIHMNSGRGITSLYAQSALTPSTKITDSILPIDLADFKVPRGADVGIQTRPYVVLDQDTVDNVIVQRVAISRSVDELIDDLIRREGGFLMAASENGGCANFGIGRTALEAHRGRTLTCSDVRFMTEDEAREIYLKTYFTDANVGLVPEPLQGIILDGNVNHGVGGNGRIVRSALNNLGADVPARGVVDARVADALKQYPPGDIQSEIVKERVALYRQLARRPQNRNNLNGWLNRMKEFGYRKG